MKSEYLGSMPLPGSDPVRRKSIRAQMDRMKTVMLKFREPENVLISGREI